MSEATAKKDELTAESDKLSTKTAQDQSASAKLKEEVATLQNELAAMAKSKAEADQLRSDNKAAFDKNSAELAQGIKGVKMALKVLKDYYAKGDKSHASADGAGSGIIGLLEVCESDFTKGLTEMTAEEEGAASDYEGYSKENEIATTMKQQDLKYKTKDAAGLDKNVAELSGDLDSTSDELAAVVKGLDKLKEMCVAKAEPYAEQKARRESEIAGLKEALQILEGEAFLQRSAKHVRAPTFLQIATKKAPEDELAKEMTHDLEMNFNKIAPFGKEDTAKELQDHAAKTQDTLVDAVENAEVAEIKRAVFRALTRLRAATIKEFDTIARLETQAIDAYNDAHHYRAENPLQYIHDGEADVTEDKLTSFHD